MAEYKDEGDLDDARSSIGICQTPSDRGEEEKEGQEVGKGGIGAVPCVFGLLLRRLLVTEERAGRRRTCMIVYRPEHLFGSYNETRHLPDCHFKVHLRKFEQSFEKSRHTGRISPRGRGWSYATKRGRSGVLPRERYMRIHADESKGWRMV
jgi:hypothetical protein